MTAAVLMGPGRIMALMMSEGCGPLCVMPGLVALAYACCCLWAARSSCACRSLEEAAADSATAWAGIGAAVAGAQAWPRCCCTCCCRLY